MAPFILFNLKFFFSYLTILDIQQYIDSGILELYVLDRLEPAKMREVESYAAEYPEIREEIDQIEITLEAFAVAAAPAVNPDILDRFLEETGRHKELQPPKSGEKATKAVPPTKLFNWLPWLIALVALTAVLYAFSQLASSQQELLDSQQQLERLQEECDEAQRILTITQQRLDELTSPATVDVILAGTDNAPDKQAIVYYNVVTEKTLFKVVNLPRPPAGKQYQLWAIDADGPKDMGVLALDLSVETLLEIEFVADVAAFAITLEDEGGKPSPDLSQLQVIGNVG